jgi:hypothetical protein
VEIIELPFESNHFDIKKFHQYGEEIASDELGNVLEEKYSENFYLTVKEDGFIVTPPNIREKLGEILTLYKHHQNIPTANGFSTRRQEVSRRSVCQIHEDDERRRQPSRKFIREGYTLKKIITITAKADKTFATIHVDENTTTAEFDRYYKMILACCKDNRDITFDPSGINQEQCQPFINSIFSENIQKTIKILDKPDISKKPFSLKSEPPRSEENVLGLIISIQPEFPFIQANDDDPLIEKKISPRPPLKKTSVSSHPFLNSPQIPAIKPKSTSSIKRKFYFLGEKKSSPEDNLIQTNHFDAQRFFKIGQKKNSIFQLEITPIELPPIKGPIKGTEHQYEVAKQTFTLYRRDRLTKEKEKAITIIAKDDGNTVATIHIARKTTLEDFNTYIRKILTCIKGKPGQKRALISNASIEAIPEEFRTYAIANLLVESAKIGINIENKDDSKNLTESDVVKKIPSLGIIFDSLYRTSIFNPHKRRRLNGISQALR